MIFSILNLTIVRNAEVVGSIPISSTFFSSTQAELYLLFRPSNIGFMNSAD